jgi:hypothetical protein
MIVERRWHMMSKTAGGARGEVLNLVPFCLIWRIDELRGGEKDKFINNGIFKYIEFWRLGMLKDNSYSKVMGPYVKY